MAVALKAICEKTNEIIRAIESQYQCEMANKPRYTKEERQSMICVMLTFLLVHASQKAEIKAQLPKAEEMKP